MAGIHGHRSRWSISFVSLRCNRARSSGGRDPRASTRECVRGTRTTALEQIRQPGHQARLTHRSNKGESGGWRRNRYERAGVPQTAQRRRSPSTTVSQAATLVQRCRPAGALQVGALQVVMRPILPDGRCLTGWDLDDGARPPGTPRRRRAGPIARRRFRTRLPPTLRGARGVRAPGGGAGRTGHQRLYRWPGESWVVLVLRQGEHAYAGGTRAGSTGAEPSSPRKSRAPPGSGARSDTWRSDVGAGRSWVRDLGFRIQDLGSRISDLGSRILGSGSRIRAPALRPATPAPPPPAPPPPSPTSPRRGRRPGGSGRCRCPRRWRG